MKRSVHKNLYSSTCDSKWQMGDRTFGEQRKQWFVQNNVWK